MNSNQKNNIITYTASLSIHLNKNAFNVPITSHIFEDGVGIITFDGNVTRIGSSAFRNCSGLTSITIPNSVTRIGSSAFCDCSNLTSITIPNSVTIIGEFAFYNCSGLTSITIPNSVTSIDRYAFRYCSGLSSITIPNSVTSIGSSAFRDCSGMTSITIPNSVTSIGDFVFYNCSGLTSINIPDGVTSIGDYAFYNCSGLTSITIPKSVTSIGKKVFLDCDELQSIQVDVNNTIYDSRNNCNAIIEKATNKLILGCYTTIIPNSVTSIGESAFSYCSRLTSITIPNSVTSIGDRAFSGCSGLTSITISNSVTRIEGEAFYNLKRKVVPTKTDDGKIKGYKGMEFKNGVMFCRDFIYEVGKIYKTNNIQCCERGFHFCTNILDVFNYYYGTYGSNFIICEVEGSEEFDFDSFSDDTKVCTSNLKVIRKLSQKEVIDIINENINNP